MWGSGLLSRHACAANAPQRCCCCLIVSPARQKLEQQLEAAAQQAAAATELAETRLREKAAADKEWGRRLSVKEKEAAAKLKEAEAQLRELQDKGKQQGVLAARPSTLLGC